MLNFVDKVVKDVSKELGNNFSRRASVRQGQFQDASTLRGKKWSLRTSQQLRKCEAIDLVSFDPNFQRAEVFCRSKCCSMTNNDPAALKRYDSGKRDLYLCPEHRDELKRKINEMCKKEGVILTADHCVKTTGKIEEVREKLEVSLKAAQRARILSIFEEMLAKQGILKLTDEERDEVVTRIEMNETIDKILIESKTGKTEKLEVIQTAKQRHKTESETKDPEVIQTPSYQSEEDLSGYIQLIPLLEKIYLQAVKQRFLAGKKILAQEAVLNVRNFLLITNAVLNPNGENLKLVLPPVFELLKQIIGSRKDIENVLLLLRGVIEIILFFFGVVYNWVRLGLSNPFSMIGAGVGGALGMIGGAILAGPLGAAGFAAGGATCGAMIGSGIYGLIDERRRRRQRDFEFEGNASGDLNIRIQ